MDFLKLFLLLVTLTSSIAERSAPVLVWESTSTSSPLSGLAAFPATSNAQLKNMLDSLDTEALVMFVMNELNVEDFSGYGDALGQLQAEFEASQHVYAPSLPDPAQVPALLSSYSRITVNVDQLDALQLAPGAQKTLLLVFIEDKPGADRSTALQRSDAIIASVLGRVRQLTSKYSAVLTGKRTSMGGEQSRRVARSLQAVADEPELAYFANFSCVYLYTSTAPVIRFPPQGDKPVLVMLNSTLITSNTSTCDNSTEQTASLTWSDVQGPNGDYQLDTVTLTLNFAGRLSGREGVPASVSSWTLPEVQLSYTGTVGGQQVTDKLIMLDMDEVYAPTHLSYHCTSRKWAAKNSNDSMDATSLELPGFQVQAFLGTDKSFGRAWDCTPFFTIPIWSGLFLSLILLLIFIWSMYMLASVPTSDRFDDPRGQPLHVPTSD